MPTCVFKTDEVRRCIEHALQSEAWGTTFADAEETPRPGLFFVHDQGVYLMSNGNPGDNASGDPDNFYAYVAYAEHCNPKTDEDWWHNACDLVGGDDFAELLPINQTWLEKCGKYEELEVTIRGDEISWAFVKPKRIVRVM